VRVGSTLFSVLVLAPNQLSPERVSTPFFPPGCGWLLLLLLCAENQIDAPDFSLTPCQTLIFLEAASLTFVSFVDSDRPVLP